MMAPPPKETMRSSAYLEALAVFFVGNVILLSAFALFRTVEIF